MARSHFRNTKKKHIINLLLVFLPSWVIGCPGSLAHLFNFSYRIPGISDTWKSNHRMWCLLCTDKSTLQCIFFFSLLVRFSPSSSLCLCMCVRDSLPLVTSSPSALWSRLLRWWEDNGCDDFVVGCVKITEDDWAKKECENLHIMAWKLYILFIFFKKPTENTRHMLDIQETRGKTWQV